MADYCSEPTLQEELDEVVELGIKAGKDETLGRVCRYMHVWASPMVDE